MDKSLVDDERTLKDFKGVTYSGYKVLEVVKRLIQGMIQEKIEVSCYWCAELICSGHYMELWELLFLYYTKYIHIANPKLCIYVATKLKRFRENMNDCESEQEQLNFRNEAGFRSLFIELVVIMCVSPKKYIVNNVRVSPNDFNMLTIKDILQAPDLSFSEKLFKDDDPKELMITVNEFSYNLSNEVSNTVRAYYWFEWVVEYAKMCKKQKQICRIQKREIDTVDEKHLANPIWLIWEAIQQEATKRGGIHEKIINSLFSIFILRYSDTMNTKRKFVVYYAISILTTNIVFSEYEILKDKKILTCVLGQLDKIFMQVKEKWASIEKEKVNIATTSDSNSENTIISSSNPVTKSQEKLKILNIFETGFVPHI